MFDTVNSSFNWICVWPAKTFGGDCSSAEAKSRKLEAKGLSGWHPSGQQPSQPDGKARGQVKDYSHNNLQKNTELKAALTGSTVRQKAKKKDAYSML